MSSLAIQVYLHKVPNDNIRGAQCFKSSILNFKVLSHRQLDLRIFWSGFLSFSIVIRVRTPTSWDDFEFGLSWSIMKRYCQGHRQNLWIDGEVIGVVVDSIGGERFLLSFQLSFFFFLTPVFISWTYLLDRTVSSCFSHEIMVVVEYEPLLKPGALRLRRI